MQGCVQILFDDTTDSCSVSYMFLSYSRCGGSITLGSQQELDDLYMPMTRTEVQCSLTILHPKLNIWLYSPLPKVCSLLSQQHLYVLANSRPCLPHPSFFGIETISAASGQLLSALWKLPYEVMIFSTASLPVMAMTLASSHHV